MPMRNVDGKTIVIRDRRKPNQYTTDNVLAREWLPILRVGDAFFFYSVYLSMANRETESSWGSLRTMAEFLQCGVDLIIRGNKLLEICELLYIETGDQRTTNEYYILDPPALTPELKKRIYARLKAIEDQETGMNWQSWAKQVRKALDRHQSLPDIWAARRAHRGGRPAQKTGAPEPGAQRAPESPDQVQEKGACDSQAGFIEQGGCEPRAPCMWDTTPALVSHEHPACDSQPEQEQETRKNEQEEEEQEQSAWLVRSKCEELGVAPTIVDVLLEKDNADQILQQLEWLPFRQPRDPAAMLVSAVQNRWGKPARYEANQTPPIEPAWQATGEKDGDDIDGADTGKAMAAQERKQGFTLPQVDLDAREVWQHALNELRLQMTRATFDTWLGGSQVNRVSEEGHMVVRVRDGYAVEWLRTRWSTPIRRTVRGITGQPVEIEFECSLPEGTT